MALQDRGLADMSACAGATNTIKNCLRNLFQTLCGAWALCLFGCSGSFEADPLVEYSTDVVISGTQPQTLVRQLDAGVYLLEIRERDIDLRVGVDDGSIRTELADALLRHGLHRTVVSFSAPSRLRITLASTDQRSWKGAAAVRILRWPKRAADAPPDDRLLGFRVLGEASSLIAQGNSEAWRAALAPLREATRRFQAANDLQALAEAEYQRGWLERSLLFEFDTSRRTAAAALGHFRPPATRSARSAPPCCSP